MGSYLNPGSERFKTSLRSQIYVDKTLLIAQVNRYVRTAILQISAFAWAWHCGCW